MKNLDTTNKKSFVQQSQGPGNSEIGPYVQDAYALDYQRCPFCELKDQPGGG